MTSQYPERDHVFNCWPLWFHKTDKVRPIHSSETRHSLTHARLMKQKGRPLNVHFFGGINMPDMYNHISPERHWQTVLVNCESLTREVLPASSQAAGKPIDGTFVIVDLKGFGYVFPWRSPPIRLMPEGKYLRPSRTNQRSAHADRLSQFWQMKNLARSSFQVSQDYFPET